MNSKMKKTALQLTINDFENHQIWTWEDDGEILVPLEVDKRIPDDFDAVFVGCKIILHDGTEVKGVIGIRMRDKTIYLISFPYKENSLLDVPLQPLLSQYKDSQLKKLCQYLNKNLSDIFPIKFETPFVISDDNKTISGSIDIT